MKRTIVIVVALGLCLGVTSSVAAQQSKKYTPATPASVSVFAGTWAPATEAGTTAPTETPRMEVTADSKRLIVKYLKEGKAPESVEFKLDGSVNRVKETRGELLEIRHDHSLRAREDGALELTTRLEAVGKSKGNTRVTIDTPPQTWTDTWEISEGGKKLRVTKESGGRTVLYNRE